MQKILRQFLVIATIVSLGYTCTAAADHYDPSRRNATDLPAASLAYEYQLATADGVDGVTFHVKTVGYYCPDDMYSYQNATVCPDGSQTVTRPRQGTGFIDVSGSDNVVEADGKTAGGGLFVKTDANGDAVFYVRSTKIEHKTVTFTEHGPDNMWVLRSNPVDVSFEATTASPSPAAQSRPLHNTASTPESAATDTLPVTSRQDRSKSSMTTNQATTTATTPAPMRRTSSSNVLLIGIGGFVLLLAGTVSLWIFVFHKSLPRTITSFVTKQSRSR